MQAYEIAIVFKPLLPEDIKSKLLPSISKAIEKLGGTMDVQDDWGKKHLAYPIVSKERTKHEEGYYVILNVNLANDQVTKLAKTFKLSSDILRYLIIKKDNL